MVAAAEDGSPERQSAVVDSSPAAAKTPWPGCLRFDECDDDDDDKQTHCELQILAYNDNDPGDDNDDDNDAPGEEEEKHVEYVDDDDAASYRRGDCNDAAEGIATASAAAEVATPRVSARVAAA